MALGPVVITVRAGRSVSEVSSSDSGENTSMTSTSVPSPMYIGKVKGHSWTNYRDTP